MNTRRIANLGLNCWHLILWNLRLSLRGYYSLINASFYLFALNFIVYLLLANADFKVKTVLFWLILFLIILYFIQQSLDSNKQELAFYYFLISPSIFLLAKIIQNTIISICFAVFNSLVFYLFFSYQLDSWGLFLGLLAIACMGFSALFSFLGALVKYSEHSSGILSILSLPLIIPQLSLILKIAVQLEVNTRQIQWTNLVSLLSLNLLILSLSLVLFRYLWKL